MTDDTRLELSGILHPATAVAAIIMIDGRYLLQLRDDKAGIFFPKDWGCFGGAVEPGESDLDALVRELKEELALDIAPVLPKYFTRFDFDLGFAGMEPIWRVFFELELPQSAMAEIHLAEGSDVRLIAAEDILTHAIPIVPYDDFALWFHINRHRLAP